jgi:uncharacterized protein YecE (DUF72 family)
VPRRGFGCGDIWIGISGWRYKPWRGVFYPEDLPEKRQLEFASRAFRSIEINGTHYRLQKPEYFARWARETPDDFVFAIKGSRFITHMLKLKGCERALGRFFASGLLNLGAKLGPILWQFPEQFRFDPERIEAFFKILPRDGEEAAALIRRHTRRRPVAENVGRLRYAMEIRNRSFVDPAFVDLLRRYGIALVCADTVEWPRLMDVTADFVYCRLHGSEVLYTSGYEAGAIRRWAGRVAAWAQGETPKDLRGAEMITANTRGGSAPRDVYVYFDNDAKVRAPYDAQQLVERVDALLRAKSRRGSAAPQAGNRPHNRRVISSKLSVKGRGIL